MTSLAPELADAGRSKAISTIDEKQREGQISEETANAAREQFFKIHQLLMESLASENELLENSRQLKQQLSKEVQNLEQAHSSRKQHEATIKELTSKIEEIKNQYEAVEDRVAVLRNEIQTLENDKIDLENGLKVAEEKKREILIPEIELMKNKIKEQKLNKENNEKAIKQKGEENKHIEDFIAILQKRASVKEENEKLANEFLAIKNDPDRHFKKNKNFENEVTVLKNEVEKIKEAIQKIELKRKKVEDNTSNVEGGIRELESKEKDKDNEKKELEEQIAQKTKEIDECKREKNRVEQERSELDVTVKMLKDTKRSENETKNQLSKEIEDKKSDYKKAEYQLNNYLSLIKEHTNKLGATTKLKEEKVKEQKQQAVYSDKVHEENQLFFGMLVKKAMEKSSMDSKKEQLVMSIKNSEQAVEDSKIEENKFLEEIKFLSTIREKMARTASQAMAQARETQEELKVKELLILDLNKKFQETEFRLNSFIALYEDVKNARNKYVSMIQNSSQDLAEMKERIKILQNEVEILRNECSEKDRALVDIKHSVTIEVYNRDSKRAELNKCDFKYKNKESISGQKINEGDKLNLIINSLEKDMNELTSKYETACEHRNYMGIQLIDRNDELCILYEKSNIHENILKAGEEQIREKEDEIRMLNLELKERQRHLQVMRKRVPDVPVLSSKVVTLKKELDEANSRVMQLSEKLEDPDKHPNWKQLPGEDPDDEPLKAKIQVLEERLNNKKEMLLEKELVCEEVSNLAEKLRKQALDGRKSTLEVTEKVNEFRARSTELSRKMLAIVSELSMFQSKALRLHQEKDEKEAILEEAIQKLERGEMPTEDCKLEWDRLQRKGERLEKEKETRQQRKQLEMQLPHMGVKTTAIPRPNSYMRPDLDIPRPYGEHPPFKPSEPGATMRHIVKPTKKPIEI